MNTNRFLKKVKLFPYKYSPMNLFLDGDFQIFTLEELLPAIIWHQKSI